MFDCHGHLVVEQVQEEELVPDGGCRDGKHERGDETLTEVRQEADDELAAAGIQRGELEHCQETSFDQQ